ncbi:MAG: amidohydrolase family protein [Ancalomicrobiaceae bacterium]|nr:amidohydrolase family protein [Ancalomicrobiaceae bacterium]
MRVDAHQHFWSINRGDYGWLTPAYPKLFCNFGPDRVMWGSDWPVLANTVSYSAGVQTTEALVANSVDDAQDIERIFGRNATAFYQFKEPASPPSCKHESRLTSLAEC